MSETAKEQLEELSKEIQEALVFNQPLLLLMLKAQKLSITITIAPARTEYPQMVLVRLERWNEFSGRAYTEFWLDPQILMQTVFYPAPATEAK